MQLVLDPAVAQRLRINFADIEYLLKWVCAVLVRHERSSLFQTAEKVIQDCVAKHVAQHEYERTADSGSCHP